MGQEEDAKREDMAAFQRAGEAALHAMREKKEVRLNTYGGVLNYAPEATYGRAGSPDQNGHENRSFGWCVT